WRRARAAAPADSLEPPSRAERKRDRERGGGVRGNGERTKAATHCVSRCTALGLLCGEIARFFAFSQLGATWFCSWRATGPTHPRSGRIRRDRRTEGDVRCACASRVPAGGGMGVPRLQE